MPAPPPESEPAMVRALGMGMRGEDLTLPSKHQSSAQSVTSRSTSSSYRHSRESGNPGIIGRRLDSRFRGNDEILTEDDLQRTATRSAHFKRYSRTLAVITRISAVLVPPIAALPTTTFWPSRTSTSVPNPASCFVSQQTAEPSACCLLTTIWALNLKPVEPNRAPFSSERILAAL